MDHMEGDIPQIGQKRKKGGKPKNTKKFDDSDSDEESGDEEMAMLAEDGGSNYSGEEKSKKNNAPLEDFSHISVFNSPILCIVTMGKVLAGAYKSCLEFILRHLKPVMISLLVLLIFMSVPLPEFLEKVSLYKFEV